MLSFTWTPADGAAPIVLHDPANGYQVQADTAGLNSPTYQSTTTKFAGVDGVRVQSVTADPGSVMLAMLLQAKTETELRGKVRGLVHAMRPKAGPGVLTVVNELGQTRSLTCYCMAGLEGDESRGATLPGRWFKAALKFMAPSPWWRGDLRTVTFGLAAPTPFFPITPVVLSSSNIQGALTVDLSDADAPSFPVWTITGPGSSLTLANITTGRTIQINAPIGDGQTLIIDTRPGMQSVRDGSGNNLMGSLASDPALWSLTEGINQVSALLAGAGSASSITGQYRPHFAGI